MTYEPGHDQPPPNQPPYGYPYPGHPGYPQAEPNSTTALLSHVGMFIGGFITPLIVYVISRDDPFARRHAAEALNAQLSYTGVAVVGTLVMVGGIALMTEESSRVLGGVIFFGLLFAVLVYAAVILVASIIGMVRAGQGQEFRYPAIVRPVKP